MKISAKQHLRDLLDRLPDDTTFEEIQRQIDVIRLIAIGIEQANRGEVILHAVVKDRLLGWISGNS